MWCEGGIGLKEKYLLFLGDCAEPTAEIRTQLNSHSDFMLAWRQILDHMGLALPPLCSLSQQCSRGWAEGAEALGPLDGCLKQNLKELVRQKWVSRPKPVYEIQSSWNKIGSRWIHGPVWEDFKREGGSKVCLEVFLVVGSDFFFYLIYMSLVSIVFCDYCPLAAYTCLSFSSLIPDLLVPVSQAC